jgi:hypothetical protein
MHLLRIEQQTQLFCLFFIFVTQTVSIPIKETVQAIRCNILHQNCTIIPRKPVSSDSLPFSPYKQNSTAQLTPRSTRQGATSSATSPTTRQRSTTKADTTSSFDSFGDNLKRAAFILAGIALGLGILRICLMLCKSRSANTSLNNRHSSTVRPQVATVEQHQFKPDLPPVYAEAIAIRENGGGKLPTYDELPYEERQEQYEYNNDGYTSTTQL